MNGFKLILSIVNINHCLLGILTACDFDDPQDPLCSFYQSGSDDIDWVWNREGTASDDTGPTGDHTSGDGTA